MNKKFILLPAAMLLLAACGGAASSEASSTPASSTTPSSATPSSAALDSNLYTVVGAFQGWDPLDEDTVMTRATGTNNFSLTLDLYVDTQWKLVINQSWDAGQVSPSSPGVIVQENGTAVADFLTAGGTNMAAVSDGFDGYNFNTTVHGNYTINFTSLPALSRVLNIVRNGDPIVPPPTNTDWYIVGSFTDPTWGDGFVPANLFTETSTPGTYEKTLDLLEGYEFKIVKMVGTTPTWNGTSILGTVTPAEYDDAVGGSDNFVVATNGNYKLTLIDGETDVLNVERLGDPIIAPPEAFDYFIAGSFTTPAWGVGFDVLENPFKFTKVSEQNYFLSIDLFYSYQFKIIRAPEGATTDAGNVWNGFDKVNSVTPEGNIVGGDGGNIVLKYDALLSANGNYYIDLVITEVDGLSINLFRNGDATETAPALETDPEDWYLVGSVTDTGEPNTAWNPADKSKALTPVVGKLGSYEISIELEVDDLFKVKTGGSWDLGRDIGFSGLISSPAGTFADDTGNIKVLVASSYTIRFNFIPSGGTIEITANGWLGYGMSIAETSEQMVMTYADIGGEWWNKNAQLNLASFDGTKTGITFTFTGVDTHDYLFKIEGTGAGAPVEASLVSDGTEQTITLDLSSKTEAERANLKLVVLFVKTAGASGSITVLPFTYVS